MKAVKGTSGTASRIELNKSHDNVSPLVAYTARRDAKMVKSFLVRGALPDERFEAIIRPTKKKGWPDFFKIIGAVLARLGLSDMRVTIEPLHLAIMMQDMIIVDLLLRYGADPNAKAEVPAKEKYDLTPLILSIYTKQPHMVTKLLSSGAGLDVGKMPLPKAGFVREVKKALFGDPNHPKANFKDKRLTPFEYLMYGVEYKLPFGPIYVHMGKAPDGETNAALVHLANAEAEENRERERTSCQKPNPVDAETRDRLFHEVGNDTLAAEILLPDAIKGGAEIGADTVAEVTDLDGLEEDVLEGSGDAVVAASMSLIHKPSARGALKAGALGVCAIGKKVGKHYAKDIVKQLFKEMTLPLIKDFGFQALKETGTNVIGGVVLGADFAVPGLNIILGVLKLAYTIWQKIKDFRENMPKNLVMFQLLVRSGPKVNLEVPFVKEWVSSAAHFGNTDKGLTIPRESLGAWRFIGLTVRLVSLTCG